MISAILDEIIENQWKSMILVQVIENIMGNQRFSAILNEMFQDHGTSMMLDQFIEKQKN